MVPANFNQLYYFWIIGKSGSISGAAKRLLLNQSTVSLQLKQLEGALGHRLVTRGRQGVALTETGRLAFDYCERVFGHATELLSILRDPRPAAVPVFRLGVSQTISRDKVLSVASFLRKAAPGVRVKIVSRSSEELEIRLERRMLDLVVSDIDLAVRLGRDYQSRLVSTVPLHFVASPAALRTCGSFPASLRSLPLLLSAPENPTRKQVDRYLVRLGIVPNIEVESESPDLLRIMALEGRGAAIVDPAGVRADLARRRLVLLHRRPIGIRENLWFVAAPRRETDAHRRGLIAALMDRFALGR